MSYVETSITRPSGFRIEIVSDDDAPNPAKDWDMVGTMVLSSRCRYDFGHKTASNEEIKALIRDHKTIALPVYMYDHSGTTINTTGFDCGWDSGQVGIMYCTRKKAVHEFGNKLCTKEVESDAIRAMVGEVKSIDDYLTGNVWGFQIFDPEGEEVDSCWGFVGDPDYCLEEALSNTKYHEEQASKEQAEATHWKEREVVTA